MSSDFKETWGTQTDIGKIYGISSIKLGQILIDEGLKDVKTKKPTIKAKTGFVFVGKNKQGFEYYMWNKHRMKSIMEKHNISKVNNQDYVIQNILDEIKKLFNGIQDDGWQDQKIEKIITNVLPKTLEKELKKVPVKEREEVRSVVMKVLNEKGIV